MLLSRALANSRDMLATTLRSIGDAVLTTDLEGRVTYLNPMAELLTGRRVDTAVGLMVWDVFKIRDESTGEPIACPVRRVLQSSSATGYSNHTYIVSAEGTERVIAYNATPIRSEEDGMLGVVLVFHCSRPPKDSASGDTTLELIERATNDVVWDWDLQTGKIWWNDAITALFGYSHEDVRSDAEWLFEHIHPADVQGVRDNLDNARRDGRRYWQREYRFRGRSGAYSAILERGYVLRDAQGRALRLVGTMMDITERREAQEELLRINSELEYRIEERTQELRKANKELESFTYSVSHDLRTPLRNILASTAILQEDSNDMLDEQARQTLTRLVQSANRMSHLIDDLLQYSRLARTGLKLERVDITALSQRVVENMRTRGECRARFTVEPDMVADADPALVTILLENLVDNACKFAAHVAEPHIQIGRKEVRGEKAYYVRDNGVGFDPSFIHKLFQPFERLHSESDYPGTGIGLANCARVVQRHGGRIWAEGAQGSGATFYFTL
jgi:PAS domain S-box-containing protein